MRKLLLCLLVLFSVTVFSQVTPKTYISVSTATTDFLVNIPIGTQVVNLATGKVYLCITAAITTDDLTSASAKFTEIGKIVNDSTSIRATSPISLAGSDSAHNTYQISLDTTKVVLFNDTLAAAGKIATKKALADGLAGKRDLNNHDSLSKLDEKSYESLTSKPVLTVTQDLPYSSVISLDSSDIILTAKEFNTLEQVGNEIKIGSDTTKLATKFYTDSVVALKANTSHTQAISTITGLQDSIDRHTDSLQSHNVRILALKDSIYRHTDSLQSHNVRILALKDSIARHTDTTQAHNVKLLALYDSIARHTDSLQSHNVRIKGLMDTVYRHTDTLQAHNTRINGRALTAHNQAISTITGLQDSLTDSYNKRDTATVLLNRTRATSTYAPKSHTQAISTITNLSDSLKTYVPKARTISINGTSYDLNANRTWDVGTLTTEVDGSITNEGSLKINNDLPYSVKISSNTPGSDTLVLTAREFLKGTLTGNEYSIESDTTKLATKFYTDSKQAITDTTTKDATRYWVGQNYQPTVSAGYRIGKSGVTINNVDYWKNQDTLKTTLNGLVKATGGVLTAISDASTNWNTAFSWGDHANKYVPLARQLTINGTAYDLSADRTWDVGTLVVGDTASLLLSRLRAGHDYAPKSHTQAISTVTGLQDSLTDSWNKRDTATVLLNRLRAASTYQPKDTLTVKNDLINSSIISHNGRNVILTADSGLNLTQIGDELLFKSNIGITAKQDLPYSVRLSTGILNTPELILTANGYNELSLKGDEVSISSDTSKLATRFYAEPKLGNPAASGYVLSSTDAGVRSWVSQAGGMSYPGAGLAKSNGSAWVTSLVDSSAYWKKAYDSVASTSYLKKFTFDANGDLIVGTGNNTYSKLARGTTGQLMAVKSDGFLEWITPSAGTTYTAGFGTVINGSVIGNTRYWGGQDSLKTTLNGLVRSAGGKLVTIVDSSSYWKTAYTHSQVAHQTIINGTGFVKASGTTLSYDNSTYLTSQISHADVVVDGDFTSNGLMKRTAAGTYGIVTDNSATWDDLVTFPGFGTTHELSAYGDHAHSDYTPTSRTLTINGTTSDLTNNRSWSVGTVTSIATSAPLTGGTITGSGTLGITQAGASSDGYLSSADWGTFNAKISDDIRWYTNETGASHFAIAPNTTVGGKTLKQVNLFTSLVISRYGGYSWGGATPPYSLYVYGYSKFDSSIVYNNAPAYGSTPTSALVLGTGNKISTYAWPTGSQWTVTGSDIYRNSKVSIGSTTAPGTDSTLLITGGQHNTGGLLVDKKIRVLGLPSATTEDSIVGWKKSTGEFIAIPNTNANTSIGVDSVDINSGITSSQLKRFIYYSSSDDVGFSGAISIADGYDGQIITIFSFSWGMLKLTQFTSCEMGGGSLSHFLMSCSDNITLVFIASFGRWVETSRMDYTDGCLP